VTQLRKKPTPQEDQPSAERQNHMGDKSPKSNQKKSNQKSAKNNAANDKKKKAANDKKTAGKK
jgi:hypothetical protein